MFSERFISGKRKERIVSAFARGLPPSIVVDSRVLVAAIDADETDHLWAKRVLTYLG